MRFEIDPRVVFRLGEDLISDDAQAIAELIKNAYDADSPWVRVTIDTTSEMPSMHGDRTLCGAVAIEDAGGGMTQEEIEHGWLRIAVSNKREMKSEGRTTARGRTPLGDKGLGRLGAQRLGEEIELVTRARGDEPISVRFSWADFVQTDTLSDVPVLAHPAERSRPGTTVRILGLREHGYWSSSDRRGARLERELSQIISPYEGVQGFDVTVQINGVRLELFELTTRLRESARARYAFVFDERTLRVRGDLRLAFLQPNRTSGPDVERYQRFAVYDEGRAFRRYLAERDTMREYGLRSPNSPGFAAFEWTVSIDELSELYLDSNSQFISPGPFHGEVDSFDLGHGTSGAQEIFSRPAQYRDTVRLLAGVRVYRDGFRVRTDRDPLGLAEGASSARSAYGLKPETTTGFLSISARDNSALTEKTDREGFQDTPAFRNFEALLRHFSAEVDHLHSDVGRAWVQYVKGRLSNETAVTPEEAPEEAAAGLGERLAEGQELGGRVAAIATKIRSVSSAASDALDTDDGAEAGALKQAAQGLREVIDDARDVLEETDRYLTWITSVSALPALLGQEINVLRDQVVLSQETMSLGITAEALVHELLNVCDQLESRSAAFTKKVANDAVSPRAATAFADFVRSTSRALRKQASHLQPSLRYIRERKDSVTVGAFIGELAELHQDRLHDENVLVSALIVDDFTIRMNRGKLTQIFDNLLLNSEYWTREEKRRGGESTARILLEAHRPTVTVSDSGPGIAPSRVARIFEPFVSSKPEGRGLGLFIVRQLLDSEGCSIYLAPDVTAEGNYNTFIVDLSGAVA